MHRRTIIALAAAAVIVAGGVVWWQSTKPAAGNADALASCLKEKGVTMYGAYWCPHCQRQKKLFGSSFKLLTYVECAAAGKPNEQTQACKDASIESYPTWVFGDGTRVTGEQSFADLAAKSGCPTP